MVTTCCVVGCKTRAKKGNGIGFYKFPKRDLERRRLWIRAVKRPNWTPTDADRVCSLHFVEGRPCHDHTNHPDWVPSIFSFGKKSPEALARNYGRFKRSLKRLQRFSPVQDSATCNVPATTATAVSQGSSPVTTSTTTAGQNVANLGSWMTPVVSQAAAEAIAAYNQGALGGGVGNAGDAPAFFVCNQDGVSIGAPSFAVDGSKKQVLLFLNAKVQAAATTGAAGKVADAAAPRGGNTESSSVNLSSLRAELPTAGTEQEKAMKTPPKSDTSRTCSRASDSTWSASEAEDESSSLGTRTPPKYAGPSQSSGSQAKADNAPKNQIAVSSLLLGGPPNATLHGKKVVLILKSGVMKAPPTGVQTTAVASAAATTTAHIVPPVTNARLPKSSPPQLRSLAVAATDREVETTRLPLPPQVIDVCGSVDSEATLSASEGEGDNEFPAPRPKERLVLVSTSVQTEESDSPCKSCQHLQEENERLRLELALLKEKYEATPANTKGTVSDNGQL